MAFGGDDKYLTTHVNGRLHDAMCQTDQKPVDDRGFFVCAERVSLPPSETGYVHDVGHRPGRREPVPGLAACWST